jgi:hypothetical protein
MTIRPKLIIGVGRKGLDGIITALDNEELNKLQGKTMNMLALQPCKKYNISNIVFTPNASVKVGVIYHPSFILRKGSPQWLTDQIVKYLQRVGRTFINKSSN